MNLTQEQRELMERVLEKAYALIESSYNYMWPEYPENPFPEIPQNPDLELSWGEDELRPLDIYVMDGLSYCLDILRSGNK